MKKYIFLFLVCSALFTLNANAQNGSLTGPDAKNLRVRKTTQSNNAIVAGNLKQLTGPQAKNRRRIQTMGVEPEQIVLNARKELTGPKAKNTFPMRKTSQAVVKN